MGYPVQAAEMLRFAQQDKHGAQDAKHTAALV
jgi:hypothetical protein